MWVKRAALNFTLEGAQTWVCFQNILVITITTDIYFLFWGERNNKWKGAIQAPQYLQTQVGEWGDSPQLLTLGKSLEISEYPQVTWSSPSHFHMWPCSWVVDRALPGRLSSHVMAERPSLLAAGGQGSVASWAQLVKITDEEAPVGAARCWVTAVCEAQLLGIGFTVTLSPLKRK